MHAPRTARSEPSFLDDYAAVRAKLARVLETGANDDVVLMMGEGMLALWAALKSVTWGRCGGESAADTATATTTTAASSPTSQSSKTSKTSKVLALASGVYG